MILKSGLSEITCSYFKTNNKLRLTLWVTVFARGINRSNPTPKLTVMFSSDRNDIFTWNFAVIFPFFYLKAGSTNNLCQCKMIASKKTVFSRDSPQGS